MLFDLAFILALRYLIVQSLFILGFIYFNFDGLQAFSVNVELVQMQMQLNRCVGCLEIKLEGY